MTTPRHPNQSPPVQWVHATWTWSSALLLSALLVSPVGADALFHLLRMHVPVVAQAADRETPAAPASDQTPRRKSEDEPPAIAADTHATGDLEPAHAPFDNAAANTTPAKILVAFASLAQPPFESWSGIVRPAATLSTPPRAPPV